MRIKFTNFKTYLTSLSVGIVLCGTILGTTLKPTHIVTKDSLMQSAMKFAKEKGTSAMDSSSQWQFISDNLDDISNMAAQNSKGNFTAQQIKDNISSQIADGLANNISPSQEYDKVANPILDSLNNASLSRSLVDFVSDYFTSASISEAIYNDKVEDTLTSLETQYGSNNYQKVNYEFWKPLPNISLTQQQVDSLIKIISRDKDETGYIGSLYSLPLLKKYGINLSVSLRPMKVSSALFPTYSYSICDNNEMKNHFDFTFTLTDKFGNTKDVNVDDVILNFSSSQITTLLKIKLPLLLSSLDSGPANIPHLHSPYVDKYLANRGLAQHTFTFDRDSAIKNDLVYQQYCDAGSFPCKVGDTIPDDIFNNVYQISNLATIAGNWNDDGSVSWDFTRSIKDAESMEKTVKLPLGKFIGKVASINVSIDDPSFTSDLYYEYTDPNSKKTVDYYVSSDDQYNEFFGINTTTVSLYWNEEELAALQVARSTSESISAIQSLNLMTKKESDNTSSFKKHADEYIDSNTTYYIGLYSLGSALGAIALTETAFAAAAAIAFQWGQAALLGVMAALDGYTSYTIIDSAHSEQKDVASLKAYVNDFSKKVSDALGPKSDLFSENSVWNQKIKTFNDNCNISLGGMLSAARDLNAYTASTITPFIRQINNDIVNPYLYETGQEQLDDSELYNLNITDINYAGLTVISINFIASIFVVGFTTKVLMPLFYKAATGFANLDEAVVQYDKACNEWIKADRWNFGDRIPSDIEQDLSNLYGKYSDEYFSMIEKYKNAAESEYEGWITRIKEIENTPEELASLGEKIDKCSIASMIINVIVLFWNDVQSIVNYVLTEDLMDDYNNIINDLNN